MRTTNKSKFILLTVQIKNLATVKILNVKKNTVIVSDSI